MSADTRKTPENTREALVAIRRVLDCFHIDGVADQMPAQQTVSPIRVGDIRKAREAADQLAAPSGPCEQTSDTGVPVEVAQELMRCASQNERISYDYLCDLWSRGYAAGYGEGLDESGGDPRVEQIEAGFKAIQSATGGEYTAEDHVVLGALSAAREFAVRLARREEHIRQLFRCRVERDRTAPRPPVGEMRSVAHEIGQVLSVYERRKVVPLTADERQMVARLTMWRKRLLDALEAPHD